LVHAEGSFEVFVSCSATSTTLILAASEVHVHTNLHTRRQGVPVFGHA